ncbi:MAG: hypothetical protein L0216_06070 [Planctomycetales bacterium]|nr:hypothetical protein [Planctomycetales bacterium]
MRGLTTLVPALALVLATAATAAAQEFREDAAPATGPRKAQGFVELELAVEALDIEMRTADTDPEAGPGTGFQRPTNHSDGNNGVDYWVRHEMIGVRFGGLYPFPGGLTLGASLLLGAMETILTEDADAGSYAGRGRLSANLETGFGLRFALTGRIEPSGQKAFGAFTYQLSAAWCDFKDDFFYSDTLEGTYSMLAHRLLFTGGYDLGFVRPFGGIGLLFYNGNADVEESDFAVGATKNKWDIEMQEKLFFRIQLGAEIPGSKGVYARVEIALAGELAYIFSAGVKV